MASGGGEINNSVTNDGVPTSQSVLNTPSLDPPVTISTASASQPKMTGQSLSDFVLQLEDYVSTIPDPVTAYYLAASGFETSDPRVVRIISLAAQKFISDIANDSLQHCKMRGAGQTKKNVKDKRYTLAMEDLTPALNEYGINVKKAHYFT